MSWWVEFEPGNTFTTAKHGGSSDAADLGRQSFQDVLLDVTVVIANGREPVTELREVFDRLSDPIVGHVIGSRLGAQAQVTALRSVTARFLP